MMGVYDSYLQANQQGLGQLAQSKEFGIQQPTAVDRFMSGLQQARENSLRRLQANNLNSYRMGGLDVKSNANDIRDTKNHADMEIKFLLQSPNLPDPMGSAEALAQQDEAQGNTEGANRWRMIGKAATGSRPAPPADAGGGGGDSTPAPVVAPGAGFDLKSKLAGVKQQDADTRAATGASVVDLNEAKKPLLAAQTDAANSNANLANTKAADITATQEARIHKFMQAGVASLSQNQALAEEDVPYIANQIARNPTSMSALLGPRNTQARAQIIHYWSENNRPDLVASATNLKADSGSQASIQKQLDQITAYEKMAGANFDRAVGYFQKNPDVGSQYLNLPLRELSKKMGDKDAQALVTALEPVKNEYARILSSGGQLGGAPLSDRAVKAMEDAIPQSATLSQILEAGKVLKADAANRRVFLQEQVKDIQGRIAQPAPGGASPLIPMLTPKSAGSIPTFTSPNDPGFDKLQSGSQFYDANGKLRTKK